MLKNYMTSDKLIDMNDSKRLGKKNLAIKVMKVMEMKYIMDTDKQIEIQKKKIERFDKKIEYMRAGANDLRLVDDKQHELDDHKKLGQIGKVNKEAQNVDKNLSKIYSFHPKEELQRVKKDNIRNDYREFYKQKKEELEKEANKTIRQKVDELLTKMEDNVSKFVVKFNLTFSPIAIVIRDHENDDLFKFSINLGELELQLDHVYERKNMVKCLGLSMERFTGLEQKKTNLKL